MANKHVTDEKTGKSKEKMKNMQPIYPFPLDWALIRLDKHNLINFLPKVELPRGYVTNLVPEKRCHRWTTFNSNSECVNVAKFGRTSGWTLGTINACSIAINPKSDPQVAGVCGFSEETARACFGVATRYKKEPFMEPGDSRSILVHDGSGTQLGLLFGQTSAGEGMALPLDLVFQDIKKITGKAVIDPPYVAPEVVGLAKYQLVEDNTW
ncbi:hypothetical protein ACET3X_003000 [Alternaria dauci]|uniref:Uncharacterized protein n=1 Tax=Alternaria dauci TaxID=48095 RepID=A0ABR3UR56_9PLEO